MALQMFIRVDGVEPKYDNADHQDNTPASFEISGCVVERITVCPFPLELKE